MALAEVKASRSPDSQTKVGCVLIDLDSDSEIAMGYNGFVRNAPDENLPTTRPDKYEYIVHAEENMIANCARLGIATNKCLLVCTLSPCSKCMRLIYQAGITQVLIKDKYKGFDCLKKMKDIEICEQETPEGFILLTYKKR